MPAKDQLQGPERTLVQTSKDQGLYLQAAYKWIARRGCRVVKDSDAGVALVGADVCPEKRPGLCMASSHVLFEADTVEEPVELLLERLRVAYVEWQVLVGPLWVASVDWKQLVELVFGSLGAGVTNWTCP